MIQTLINISIIIIALVILDFVIEAKFHIRKRIVKKVGVLLTIILSIVFVAGIDTILLNYWPELQNNELYKFTKIGFIVYFVPKKGDKT